MTHPITPPPELVQQWADQLQFLKEKVVFTEIAQWGADQELEACCEWLANKGSPNGPRLRAARRPKPPSLKQQALNALGTKTKKGESRLIEHRDHELIRRALEALPND